MLVKTPAYSNSKKIKKSENMKRESWIFYTIFMIFTFCFAAGVHHKVEIPAHIRTVEKKKVALTFDDGPNNIYTPKLLDGLKQRGVKAAFFLMGKRLEGNEELVRRMYEEGHLIGNHTYNHVQLSQLSKSQAKEEIERTSNEIYRITGEYPVYVRPPFGEWREDIEYAVEMLPVFWSIDPLDWKRTDTAQIAADIEKEIEDGSIILMHDSSKSSVEAAFMVIDDLCARGYEFVTVDRLIMK